MATAPSSHGFSQGGMRSSDWFSDTLPKAQGLSQSKMSGHGGPTHFSKHLSTYVVELGWIFLLHTSFIPEACLRAWAHFLCPSDSVLDLRFISHHSFLS